MDSTYLVFKLVIVFLISTEAIIIKTASPLKPNLHFYKFFKSKYPNISFFHEISSIRQPRNKNKWEKQIQVENNVVESEAKFAVTKQTEKQMHKSTLSSVKTFDKSQHKYKHVKFGLFEQQNINPLWAIISKYERSKSRTCGQVSYHHFVNPKNTLRTRRDAETCLAEGSCSNNKYQYIPVCYCDALCRIFNDCCHDNDVTTDIIDVNKMKSNVKLEYTSCVHIIPHGYIHSVGYVFVTKCPENESKNDVKFECEKKQRGNEIPVIGQDGLTYKNKYCAMCHGVKVDLNWNLIFLFDCDVSFEELMNIEFSNEIIELFKSRFCRYEVSPPKITHRPRVCWEVDHTNFTNVANKTLCEQYQHPAYIQGIGIIRRNIFCQPESYKNNLVTCMSPMNESSKFSPQRMSALFNFNVNTENKDCIRGEKKTCKFEAVIGNGMLEMNFRLLTNASLDICFRVLGISYTVLKHLLIPWQTENNDLQDTCYIYPDVYPCFNSASCFKMHVRLFFKVNGTANLKNISEFYTGLSQMVWKYVENHEAPLLYTITTLDYMKSEKIYDDHEIFYYDQVEMRKYLILLERQIKILNTVLTTFPSYLEVSGYHAKNDTDLDSDIEKYRILNISLIMNSDVKNHTIKTTNMFVVHWNNIQIISTYVVMGVSTVFLISTLLIHKCINLSGNSAGKLSEHFIISMIFSHLLFMFGFGANDYYLVCFVIGIVSHYAWLCCFTWMTTYTITLLKAMHKLKVNPNTSMTSGFSVYNYIICYGFPLLIVIPSASIDFFTSKIGYGKDVCLPSHYPNNIIVFIGPISISIVTNFVAMIVAGRLIYTFQKSINNISSAIDTRSYWPVYLRFFIFSGLSWSLGIIAEATHQDILRMLFIILAGSHGFMFSVSILISRQVLSRLKSIKRRNILPAHFSLEHRGKVS